MKIVHWVNKNGSGMGRVAEELSLSEKDIGLDSYCLECERPADDAGKPDYWARIEFSRDADIHVEHTHIPDEADDPTIKKVWIAHGTPETCFRGSINEASKGVHGVHDGFMASIHMLRTSDAVVTFWERHAAIWSSLMDKRSIVDCVPLGVNKQKWHRIESMGKWAGEPSILTSENCHEIKWPLDLMISWSWVINEVRTARLHLMYLPLDQSRWWGALTFNNRSAYRSFISSIAMKDGELINALSSIDYYIGLVRYGDHNRMMLEAKACGTPVISYRGNEYADFWVDEGDQRTIASQLAMILKGQVPPRETMPVPDISETARAMKKIYERLL